MASKARRAACTSSTKLEERERGVTKIHHLLGGFLQNIVHMAVVNPPHVQVKANQGCTGPRWTTYPLLGGWHTRNIFWIFDALYSKKSIYKLQAKLGATHSQEIAKWIILQFVVFTLSSFLHNHRCRYFGWNRAVSHVLADTISMNVFHNFES